MWGHRNLPRVISLCIHNREPSQVYIHYSPVYEAKSTLFWWISICYTVVVMVARIHFLKETSSYKGSTLYSWSINPSKRLTLLCPASYNCVQAHLLTAALLMGWRVHGVRKISPPIPTHTLNHTLVSQDPEFPFQAARVTLQELYEASFLGLCTWVQGIAVGGLMVGLGNMR